MIDRKPRQAKARADRTERLKDALKANLSRRKAQAKARAKDESREKDEP
jgi:hypothetical protein